MIEKQDLLYKDMEAVRQISIVPMMLEVVCQLTGMGFAAVARVTNNRWLACKVRDEVGFGLTDGGELEIETTLCNEIRDSTKPIIIDNVAEDPEYRNHHIPRIYGLQSYISFPIILQNGAFFGTLCAISSKPAELKNTKVMGTFKMFSELLSFHLQTVDVLERSMNAQIELQDKNKLLASVNFNLDNFVYTASHDLKAPISNIQGLLGLLARKAAKEDWDRDEVNKIVEMMTVSLNRFSATIQELTTIVKADKHLCEEVVEPIHVEKIIEDVKQDLKGLIEESSAKIEVLYDNKLHINISKTNLKSVIYNLLSNALKYRSPERTPMVTIKLEKIGNKIHLSIIDNGLGVPADKQEKIFLLSNRLHNHVEGSGIGLFIVKRIVDQFKGQIHVDSVVNEGTTITIIF